MTSKPPPQDLSIEPIDKQDKDKKSAAQFKVDTRSGNDRRQSADRRNSIRFEEDRRKKKQRSTDDVWKDNSNI